jgi:hypothetical protein
MMNETGGRGRWHRAWRPRAGVLAVTAGVVLLAAACGGSSSSTGSGGSANAEGSANAAGSVGGAGSASTQMLAFARCMRSRGVPNWPDPAVSATGQPNFPVSNVPGLEQNYRLPSSVMAKAQVCQHLMPSPIQALPLG